jgi:glucokinase
VRIVSTHESNPLQILTGDVGGTNTRLALASQSSGQFRIEQREVFASGEFASLSAVLERYLPAAAEKPQIAAFGVAGPVDNGHSHITNLPWELSEEGLARALGINSVYLLNDLAATAWGIATLDSGELFNLHRGDASGRGNQAVIAAGTGLGQAGLYFDGHGHKPFATEGGHGDFSPSNERDWQLWQFLQRQYGHVSWERVLSGPGLVTLFDCVLQLQHAAPPDWRKAANIDAAAEITRRALNESNELCVETLDWFVELYGREAGNLALKMNCRGGLYLAGGIAPKILPALQTGRFIQAFLNKGRMRPLLEAISVNVICSDLVSLKGLARYAIENSG